MALRAFVLMLLFTTVAPAQTTKPNILLILADDLGYSDLGCYGSEIATPNLDALAKNGVRFKHFYNTARCWPSRAAILTGYYAQQVRRDTVPDVKSGNAGTRPEWARLLPELLAPAGYRSYHSGKWHVDGLPLKNGFLHSYSLNDHDRHFGPKQHTKDDVRLPEAKDGYYSSTFIADHAIECLTAHAKDHAGKPFFQFLAFTAPHFPLQAPAIDIEKYGKVYSAGWDDLREARWKRMQKLGLGGTTLAPVERDVGSPYPKTAKDALPKLGAGEVNEPKAWKDLTAEQREFQAKKMAVHAAMVDRMDREIGRVIEMLKKNGQFENTLILFLSDNGASAEIMVRGDGHDPHAECGTGATFLSLGAGWSTMANTPHRRHKTWVHEGGISTPFIVHWPKGIVATNELRAAPAHAVDLVPTFLELVGVKFGTPDSPALPGVSLVPIFAKETTVKREPIWWLHEGNKALRDGPWKIVSTKDGAWELYDMTSDCSETKNLAKDQPERVKAMAAAWQKQWETIRKDAKR